MFQMLHHFRYSGAIAALCFLAAYMYAGWTGLMVAIILSVLEVSLSFDNAVVNAGVLRHWNHFWRTLFLTVGIFIAVFGMRLLFPLLIVSQTTDMSIIETWNLAINDPKTYSAALLSHHAEVLAFGGAFLFLVFFNFLFDPEKDVHWHSWIEEKMAKLGKINAMSAFATLSILVALVSIVPEHEKMAVLMAGVYGILTYLAVDFIGNLLEEEETDNPSVTKVVSTGGIGGFLYLEVLDASFSFDGVISAFAITTDIVVIMLGLCVGAFFVRSMTTYMVDKGTLDAYKYLEHGAHYAIGVLAAIMFISVEHEIPEVVTGLIGVAFIVWAVMASLKEKATTE